jgi:hypothetical protein
MPNAARERVASPPAGTALAPQSGTASRTASDSRARFGAICNENGDYCQWVGDDYFPSS